MDPRLLLPPPWFCGASLCVAYLKWLSTEGLEGGREQGVRYFSIPSSAELVTKTLLNCSLSGL